MRTKHLSQLAQRTSEPAISWLMKMTLDHPSLISLAAGFTDNPSLPLTESREILEELLGSPRAGRPALQYGSTQGDPALRRLTASRLEEMDARPGDGPRDGDGADRTIITHGSQQLLYLVTECLCDPGDIVLVEDPTYFVYLGITQSHGLQCRGVAMESDGLNLEHLDRTLKALKDSGEIKRVKLLYLVTYFQNPSGVTTSLAKKQAAHELLRSYERAAGHPLYLLEDAAYRELRFRGEDVPSALSSKRGVDRVIYAGTYSKPFATGIRVGFGILPEPVFTAALRAKGNHDFGTAHLLQQLLLRALQSCRYRTHLASLQTRYARKAAVMVGAIREHFPAAVQWEEPSGGLYVWARLPATFKTGARSKIFREALGRDVLYVPGELCYAADVTRPKPNCEMRLSFGGASERDIRQGIERLAGVLERWL